MTQLAERLGLLYAVTGERRYAERLRDAMAHYARFARWTGPANLFRDPPWHAELTTTRLLYGFALGYDFCYDVFTEAERAMMEEAMCEKGIRPLLTDWVLPDTRVHALDSMGHNWWAVCIAFAGIGLLTICEKVPEADEWMPLILEALGGFCTYSGERLFRKCANFDEKGLFYESLGYCNYGVGELLRFAFMWRRCGGDPAAVDWPPIASLPQAVLPMLYPTDDAARPLLAVDFGDSATDTSIRLMAGFWLLCGNRDPRFAACWQAAPDGGKYGLFDFLYPDILRGETAPVALPQTASLFPGGCAFVRDSWAPDATLWAVRCGFTWNHAHEDAGHFQVFDRGVPLLADSGSCPYGQPIYSTYYRRAAAHNVVLVNGAGPAGDPVERGSAFAGDLSHLVSGHGLTYLLADASGPMAHVAERAFRSFLWWGSDVLVIADDLRLYHEGQVDWLLHFAGEGTFRNGGLTVQNGPASADVRPLWPHTAEWREGRIGRDWETPRPYAAFVSESREPVQSLLTVVLLDGARDEVTVTPLAGRESLGVSLQRDGRTCTVWYNQRADGRRMHVNSNQRLGDWDTDAYMLADTEDALLLAGGSYLRRDGRAAYASFCKEFCVIEKS